MLLQAQHDIFNAKKSIGSNVMRDSKQFNV